MIKCAKTLCWFLGNVRHLTFMELKEHGRPYNLIFRAMEDLTSVNLQDCVGHGCQHPLPFQDVDIPQSERQRERGLGGTKWPLSHTTHDVGMTSQQMMKNTEGFSQDQIKGKKWR